MLLFQKGEDTVIVSSNLLNPASQLYWDVDGGTSSLPVLNPPQEANDVENLEVEKPF